MTSPTATIPGYIAGTWDIDPVHSDVSFVVRHLGVSKVRGRFDTFSGQLVTAENPLESSVTATIDASTISTRNGQRDEHVRSEDFLHTGDHPEITYRSTGVRFEEGDVFILDGELTVRGVTKHVPLVLEINGFGDGMQGGKVAGFSATTEISRKEFGVTGGAAGAVVSDKIQIALEIEATLREG
jgi:polyisoprenoid-binding protein YceI